MPLSRQEVQGLITKLRYKYDECSQKYDRKWFDKTSFEDRLNMAVSNKMKLEPFILAEIANFEKLKEKYEEKKNPQGSFSDKVDRIIDEQLKRIKQYPKIDFSYGAALELKHLYGAMNTIYEKYLPAMWIVLKNSTLKQSLTDLEESMSSLAEIKSETYSRFIEDHILILKRPGVKEIDIEKHGNGYIKECAFVLYDIIELCQKAVDSRDPDFASPFNLANSYVNSETKKKMMDVFSGLTGYGIILELKEYSESVLENFRLTAFRRS